MKKLFVLIFALLMLCGCGTEIQEPVTEEPQSKPEISELGEGSRILENCIFKTADEKYGVQKEGKIVLPATYEKFKRVSEFGGITFYALGYKDGTKPCVLWNEDGKIIGKGETERTLYDIFDSYGNMLLSFPVDDFSKIDGGVLRVTLEGTLYIYTFSEAGEIINEEIYEKGKTGDNYFGFDETVYHYDTSGLGCYRGLVDAEGNEVVPEIYSYFERVFEDRMIAKTYSGLAGFLAFRLYDSECNVICEKYSTIDYCPVSEREFVGIGQCDYPESQAYMACRDENGDIMPGGFWFIDRDGNALSEHFDIRAAEIKFSWEEKTAIVTDVDGNVTTIPVEKYILDPKKFDEGEASPALGYDFYAAVTNKEIVEGKYIPKADVLPKEVVWAKAEQKKYCEDLIDGISIDFASAFIVGTTPDENGVRIGISKEQANKLLKILKETELAIGEPTNPNMPAATEIHIAMQNGEYIKIVWDTSYFTVYEKGERVAYRFDASKMTESFAKFSKFYNEMFENGLGTPAQYPD